MDRQLKESEAKRIINFYVNIVNRVKSKVVPHFVSEVKGEKEMISKKRHVYKVTKRYLDENRVELRKNPGRPAIISSPQNCRNVKRLLEQNPTTS
jgi:hypothetical protein